MKNIIKQILNQIQQDKIKRRRMHAALLVLSLFVASGVLWQLKITGITMTGEALCGHLEHQHSADCLGMKQVCGLEESEGHQHEIACYQTLVCSLADHDHESTCYITEETPTCLLEETEGHHHGDACWMEGYLCGYEEEHTHTLLCYSNREADLETSSDWEKTIPVLTRDPATDLAAIARSQLGYGESAQNYKVSEDGTTKMGYSRYGEWYGNPYGEWNAMFASFCLRYAEHPAYETLKSSGAESMRLAAEHAEVYHVASGTVPYVGDLVFLDKDSSGSCETVAIVVSRYEGGMTVVEGDCGGVVAENQYSLDNGTILGYALLTAQPATLEENAEEEIIEVDDVITNEAKNGDVVPSADGNITISFVINNANYTDDNGLTHAIVKLTEKNNPSADGYSTDGGLTYEHWITEGGKYKTKITGTGTLMTRTIPVGTTLSGSSYSLPSLSVANISGSAMSYGSAYSWVTDTGLICNEKTVFTEDTTLYLCLYESGTNCGLNWVCNCNNGGSHSITNYVSGFGSPSFTWGQSVSEPYIPTAEAVNSMYTGSQHCTAGPDHGMQFKGWYVKNAEGEEIDFTAGVPILQDYVDADSSGYSVKVYARWEEVAAPATVTATFVNGETQVTETLNSGDVLGNKLPAVTAPDGQIFLGWKIGDTDAYATAETVIEADTTYTAVFVKKVTVVFVNDEATVETRELAENSVLGELPPPPVAEENQTFLGWQAEGEEGYASAETVITADITFHAKFTTNVTLTFMNNGEQYGETVKIPEGALLWSYLPQAPEYSGDAEQAMVFAGWKIGDTDNYVTQDTVAGTDMVLHADFEEVTGYEIYLHDMAPDGVTDYEAGEQDIQISQTYLAVGTRLAEELAENPYYMLHDDVPASQCHWYIKQLVDGVETYVPYDLNDEVTSDLHLYTFNYSVTLTREEATSTASFLDLFAVASAAEIKVEGNTLTLTLREGEKPTAADFVIDGVDYTLYTWTYTDSNGDEQTLDISDIIANGVTANITATSDGSSIFGKNATESKQHISFYVIVNGSLKLVKEADMTVYNFGTSDSYTRYRISEAVLADIYKDYGLLDITEDDQYKFAFNSGYNPSADLLNDVPLYEFNGLYFAALEKDDKVDINFFYLPNVEEETSNGTIRRDWEDFKETNSFYSVSVQDGANLIYPEGEKIPPVQYVLTGGTVTLNLPAPSEESEATWLVNGVDIDQLKSGENFKFIQNSDGTYTFSNITGEILISAYAENLFDITYNINLRGAKPTSTVPTINGADTYTESVQVKEDGNYVILTPSRTRYTVDAGSALRTVVFTGWAVNGDTTKILNAGDSLSAAELKAYGSVLNLVAQWEQQKDHSVSFYINLELQVADYTGSTGSTPDTTNYTPALYGTEVVISPCPQCDEGSALFSKTIIEDKNQNATAAVDAQVRELVNGVTATYMGKERTFTLGSFPNDESMLAAIRETQEGYIAAFQTSDYYSATDPTNVKKYREEKYEIICTKDANGVLRYIPVDELTSEYYTIRWYVFKFDQSDGWHVDGVLVKKQGQLTVTKTFYGNETAITDVKPGYSITVNEVGTTSSIYELNLNAKSDTNTNGYTAYDSSSDTYTWVIPLTTNKQFTLYENGYLYTNPAGATVDIATLAEYRIVNAEAGTMPTNGRENYDGEGVTVMAKAYNVDLNYTSYQTVQFYNSYIPTNAMPISKVDDSGNPLPGVTFQLYKDNKLVDIWRDNAGTYYIYEPANVAVEKVENGYISVDDQGYALVMGLKDENYTGGYTFSLVEEIAPEGYAKIQPIDFKVNEDGSINLIGNTSAVLLPDGTTMRVTNTSNTMDITAVKQWLDGTNADVKVRLTLDGTPLTGYAEQTLNADNNWTATWEDVPAFVGGKLANYSVRETWIGNTAYNGSYADGYDNYLVNVTAPVYTYDDSGLPTAATITVTNRTHMGGLAFTKVNEQGAGLAGAGFQLFTDEACETEYGTGEISDLYGNVNFGSLAAGTYYMKEIRTPAGYQENDTVYKIVVSGSATTITVNGNDTPISTITNIPATAALKVQKVDEENNPLTGASFKVYMLNGETGAWDAVIRNGQTGYSVDDSGKLTVPDLMPGDYKLVEASAPAGYYRMTEEIEFTVALATIRPWGDAESDSWSFDGETITVVNVTGSELPQTGGIGTHYGTMAGLLMMLSSLLYGFLLRRKRERGAV